MSHWGVQILVGRLLTDQAFRHQFNRSGRRCLNVVRSEGLEISPHEGRALLDIESATWDRLAASIDARLHVTHRPPATVDTRPLTTRERRVLRGVFDGLTNKQIAAHIGASEAGVKSTLQHLFRKLHVRTRAQLVRVVIERGAATFWGLS